MPRNSWPIAPEDIWFNGYRHFAPQDDLGGRAHRDMINSSLKKLAKREGKMLKVDAVKVSHHGSKNNINPEFFDLVDARHYLFSTNGDQHNHPDAAAVGAVVAGSKREPVLWFNYRSEFTRPYEARADCRERGLRPDIQPKVERALWCSGGPPLAGPVQGRLTLRVTAAVHPWLLSGTLVYMPRSIQNASPLGDSL